MPRIALQILPGAGRQARPIGMEIACAPYNDRFSIDAKEAPEPNFAVESPSRDRPKQGADKLRELMLW